MFSFCTHATTWNEPWQETIIKTADYFVLGKVISSDAHNVKILIIKSLGKQNVGKEIEISNFYLLDICSSSGGDGPEFNFEKDSKYYFFLKKNERGQYCIATPTAGFDIVQGDNVVATYRHSYHQTLVPVEIYEKTMSAIFANYHNEKYDHKFIENFTIKYLSMKPAGFEKEEMNTFFLQHVALETIYHLRLPNMYTLILPFLNDTKNFHNQISAARALISYNTSECKEALVKIIADTISSDFSKTVCVWTLENFKPIELKARLIQIEKSASEAENGFGGNIMDPRVCTYVPNVKESLNKLTMSL